MREEGVECFAKLCSSTSRLEHCFDELGGGTNAKTKLAFPVYYFSNKLILRLASHVANFSSSLETRSAFPTLKKQWAQTAVTEQLLAFTATLSVARRLLVKFASENERSGVPATLSHPLSRSLDPPLDRVASRNIEDVPMSQNFKTGF